MIYLYSAEGGRLTDGCSLHHLPAFILPILLSERGPGVGLTPPSPSQRYNSRKRLFGQEVCALRRSAFARLSGHGITHLDFAGQSCVPCPLRGLSNFPGILPAAPVRFLSLQAAAQTVCQPGMAGPFLHLPCLLTWRPRTLPAVWAAVRPAVRPVRRTCPGWPGRCTPRPD